MALLTEKRLTIGMIVLLAGILVASIFQSKPPAAATGKGLVETGSGVKLGFDYIKDADYKFDANLPATTDQPPPAQLKSLNGRTVEITGFVMPLYNPDPKKLQFILAQSPNGCCFGLPPQIQHLVLVRVDGQKVDFQDTTIPYVVKGTFSVGIERDSDGFVTSLLRIQATSVVPAA
jgi:hypothetical protein